MLFVFQVLTEPGYGMDVRCHGFVPFTSAPVKPHSIGSAPSSPLKVSEHRWGFPPTVQRNLDTVFHSGDHISSRLGT